MFHVKHRPHPYCEIACAQMRNESLPPQNDSRSKSLKHFNLKQPRRKS